MTDAAHSPQSVPHAASRRDLLRYAGGLGAALALGSLPVFETRALADARLATPALVPAAEATTLWYSTPGTVAKILEQGLPLGNGRIGALTTGDPAADTLFLTDATLWTGGLNATLGSDGQFPYGTADFGTVSLLAKATVKVPGHTGVTGYRRQLDLSNGYASASYTLGGVSYQREAYASHPDDVVIVRLTQSGGGTYTGSVALAGTHGETTAASGTTVSFSGSLANGLKYGCVVTAASSTGTISVSGSEVTFSGCADVVLVICGGTNYRPDASTGFKDAAVDPLAVARTKASAAAAVAGDSLLAAHVADYRALYGTMSVNLGTSTSTQRSQDTPTRLTNRAATGAAPDPELEASYLQFGRYLTITGSRSSVPLNLQGLWLDKNNPDWMSDYHTDINVQMNYWLTDRAGLSPCFDAFADYCVSQLSSWKAATTSLFQDSRNWFRNTSGKVAGWTLGISTNVWGGSGWWWHPAGNAWMCNSLFEHYEFTQDTAYLQKVYPLLKGACEFWEARLVTTTVTDPTTGQSVDVLVDDGDWSPEHGPTDSVGITYSQELVWQLFANFRTAAARLGVDSSYAGLIKGLQDRLYLPRVSSKTGWLEEWMSEDNLGETTHRHLSPLVGLFPGDRLAKDVAPAATTTGVTNLLSARGMSSYGWAMAWRGLCWARLKDSANAYQAVLTVMKPSVRYSNGSAFNFFDMYSFGTRSTFQIDANFGTPTAMLEMLVYSRPGRIELLPATPSAWGTGSVTGVGAKGGFVIDLTWASGAPTSVTVRSVGGTSTTVVWGSWSQQVTLAPGGSVTLTPESGVATGTYVLVNRRSGKALDVPNASLSQGTALIQWTQHGGTNQQWRLAQAAAGVYTWTNVNSGLVADVNGGSTAEGVTVIQWPSTGGTNQQWRLTDLGGGYYKVVNVRSGRLLAVRDASTTNGAAIVQLADTGDASQQWQLVRV